LGVPEALRVPAHAPWQASERLQREYDAIGFFLTGHPLDDYAGTLKRLKVQSYVDFAREARGGATVGKLAATVLDRSERRTKSGSKMGIFALSDRTGHFEAIIFQEGLNQFRDVLERGQAVVLIVQAQVEGEDVRIRIQSAELLERAASRLPTSLRITLSDVAPMSALSEMLKDRGDGEVLIVLPIDGGLREVEMKLQGGFRATPQIAGAIRTIPGIVAVEHG
jgi:DNA polymerase-3 subunit alpha